MPLRNKWCVFKVATRWFLILICWSIGYLVFHQVTQSDSINIRPAGIDRELLSSENEVMTKNLTTTETIKPSMSNLSISISPLSSPSTTVENPYARLMVAPEVKMSAMQLIKKWAAKIPSLPLQYLRTAIYFKQEKCASYPKLPDITFHNDIWQAWTSKTSGATFYIFGAYWDNRRKEKPAVHLLVMVDRLNPPDVICQLWYGVKGQNTPIAVEPTSTPTYSYIWNSKWGNFRDGLLQSYLLTCVLTSRKDPPLSVSLVEKPCQNATNNVRVIIGKEKTKLDNSTLRFAVCVKGMNYYSEDVSVRLIEWLELLRILGVSKVFTYDLAVHPNVSKVLKYYINQNFVHVSPLTLPGSRLNVKSLMNFYFYHQKIFKRQAELIPYNDCFYRHRHEYDYIVLLDIDEIIVPLQDDNWDDLLRRLKANASAPSSDSFYASNVYFFDDSVHSHGWNSEIPPYMHMMQHTWRARNHTKPGTYVKSFFDTQTVLTLHNHLPFRCVSDNTGDRSCKNTAIDVNIAQLQHYRKDCVTALRDCKNVYHKYLVNDNNLRRYLKTLVRKTNLALVNLGFMNSTQIKKNN